MKAKVDKYIRVVINDVTLDLHADDNVSVVLKGKNILVFKEKEQD